MNRLARAMELTVTFFTNYSIHSSRIQLKQFSNGFFRDTQRIGVES